MEVRRGVNLVGYLRGELGIGEAARLLLDALRASGLPYLTITHEANLAQRQEHPFSDVLGPHLYDINVICLNPPELRAFAAGIGPEFFEGRYTIGVWWWELSTLPRSYAASFGLVDEVWVGSEFIRDAIKGQTRKPVRVVPLPVRIPAIEPRPRGELGLPEGFLFLYVFDFLSVVERKNPLAIVDAFARAFDPGGGPVLLLKTINGDHRPNELEEIRASAAARPDVHVIDRYVSAEERDEIIASCDCYISLHRSEGLGLTIAEAMALGKPVIATRYSGNLDFMTDENSFLIGWSAATVPQGCDPYPAGSEWAEPDRDEAAAAMRQVWKNFDSALTVGARARSDVTAARSVSACGRWIAECLARVPEPRASIDRSETWPALALASSALREAESALSEPEISSRSHLGPGVSRARALVIRLIGGVFRQSLLRTLREIVLVQQQIARELEQVDARVRALEREADRPSAERP